jgi:biopolymer transport protein TolR
MGANFQTGNRMQPSARLGRKRPVFNDINVTPMVDVMLVLLIVFMVAAPLLTVGVPVDLPKTQAQNLSGEDEPLVITINAKGDIFLQESEVKAKALIAQLKAITASGYDQRIYVRGDQAVNYGRVADVVARINAAGFTRVALVTESKTER